MKFSTFLLLSALAGGIWLMPGSLVAQEGESVTLQFIAFPPALDPDPVLLFAGEGEVEEVETPGNELSPLYRIPRQAAWSVVEPIIGEDGEPAFNVLGTAPAIASPSQLVLLIRKGAENSDGFDLIVVDNRATQFGGGKFFFLNASGVNIGGLVGGGRFTIAPRENTIIRPRPEEPGSRVCHVALYYPKDGEPKNFFSTKWPLNERARGLIFIYQDPRTDRLRLHTIRDFLEDSPE